MSLSNEFEPGNQDSDPTIIEFPYNGPDEYWADVQKRVSIREPETTATGATIYNELVTFIDSNGHKVVRELTIAEPNTNVVEASPYAWVETDPWTTGPRGINRDKIQHYVDLGLPVVWLHHGGRYSPLAKDKSTSRSAHQMHALLDDMDDTMDANLREVLLGGYSRGAMTAEKFIDSSSLYDRAVLFSDTEAPCFVKDMSRQEKIETLIRQVPGEIAGIGRIALKLLGRAIEEDDFRIIAEYAKTPDLHPRNVINEFMWKDALINASVGRAIEALPEDTVGIRTFFTQDIMSQQAHHEELYEALPGIKVVTEYGPHVAGAYPENLQKKYDKIQRIMDYMQSHSGSLLGIQAEDVLAGHTEEPARRRHLWAV